MLHRLQVSHLLSLIPLIFLLASMVLTGCKAQSRRVEAPESIEIRGVVTKPGSYIVKDGDTMTIPKALELAGGLTASPRNLRAVVRHEDGSTIFVNLLGLLVKKTPDITVRPGDSLTIERIILCDPPTRRGLYEANLDNHGSVRCCFRTCSHNSRFEGISASWGSHGRLYGL